MSPEDEQPQDGFVTARSPYDEGSMALREPIASADSSDSAAAEPFYVFIDRTNPMTVNLETVGMVFSTPFFPGQPDWLDVLAGHAMPYILSPFMTRVLSSSSMRRVEAAVEAARRRYAPHAPSRTTALFAFRDLESVRLSIERHGWRRSELTAFDDAGIVNAQRVDMEFVSAAQGAADNGLRLVDEESWWRGYWAGQAHPPEVALTCLDPSCSRSPDMQAIKDEPIWEWVIEGRLRLREGTSDPVE